MTAYTPALPVPAIAAIVYTLMDILKTASGENERLKRLIPLISVALGAIGGLLAYFFVPGFLTAQNALVAAVLGAASGLSATGTNQIVKQLAKAPESETKSGDSPPDDPE